MRDQKQFDDGGPAFPLQDWDPSIKSRRTENGISIRDYFAAKSLVCRLAASDGHNFSTAECAARHAYEIADAMLAERKKRMMGVDVEGELLDALEGLLNALPSATTHPAINAARAAIAKATGGAS